jgi:hypothetical protein
VKSNDIVLSKYIIKKNVALNCSWNLDDNKNHFDIRAFVPIKMPEALARMKISPPIVLAGDDIYLTENQTTTLT